MEDVFYAGGRFENIDKRRKTCAMLKTNKPPRGICALADTRMKSMSGEKKSVELSILGEFLEVAYIYS